MVGFFCGCYIFVLVCVAVLDVYGLPFMCSGIPGKTPADAYISQESWWERSTEYGRIEIGEGGRPGLICTVGYL